MAGNNYDIIINKNKNFFDTILLGVHDEKEDIKKIEIIQKASHFAVSNQIGVFNSSLIESLLIDMAESVKCKVDNSYKKNSFLHVFTRCYNTGGHTRVCEKWIKYSSDKEVHSVALISQDDEVIPEDLQNYVKKKNGNFITLEGDCLEKSIKLRKIASSFEMVILHTNMDDPIPILSFGNELFKRPVIFFNHGDHLFWLGVSISDIVVNLRSLSQEINIKCRDVKNNFLLPLPIEEVDLKSNKLEEINKVKLEIGFTKKSKIIIVVASGYKFQSFDNYDFIDTISQILDKGGDICLLVIGPTNKENKWRELIKKYKNRVKVIGPVSHAKIDKYIQIADLGVDSFPFGSFTSLLHIGSYNIPCFSLKTPINEIDSFVKANIFCNTQKELIKKVDYFFQTGIVEQDFFKEIKRSHFQKIFSKNLQDLYKKTPKCHNIRKFNDDKGLQKFREFKYFVYKLQNANKKDKISFFTRLVNTMKKGIN